jgi:hypothetical protein
MRRLALPALALLFFILSVPFAAAQDTAAPELDDAISVNGRYIDLFFSEEVDSAIAVDAANYEIAAIVHDGVAKTLTVDSVEIEESHISVRIKTVETHAILDWEFIIVARNIEDVSGNAMIADTVNFIGTPADGYANWGDPDGYVVTGSVLNGITSQPVTDFLVPIHNDGLDGEHMDYGISDDDVQLHVRPDVNGLFRVEGLPSSPGVNMSESGDYELSVWSHEIYEPYGWGFNLADHADSLERTITLYPIAEGTRIEGRITRTGSDEPVSFWGYSADDVMQIMRGDVSVWTHPPNYIDSTDFMFYDPLSGEYHAHGGLGGGGTYDIHVFLPGTESVTSQIHVTPGATATLNVELDQPLPPSYLHQIIMVDGEVHPTPDESTEITLSWHRIVHDSVNSYVVGFWNESQILESPNPDSLWTRIAPNILHFAVPATDTFITLGSLTGPRIEVLSHPDAEPMEAYKIHLYEQIYWGVYSSTWGPDSLTTILLEDHFSGYPENGLQQLIAPTPDPPVISQQYVSDSEVKIWLTQDSELIEQPEFYIRSYHELEPLPEFSLYTDTITVDPSIGSVTVEAYVTGYRWSESEMAAEIVESTSSVVEAPGLPDKFALNAVYPNPFNPETTVSVSLPSASDLTVEVFDILGRRVAVLAGGLRQPAGITKLAFDGSSLASGLYFIRATVPGELNAVRKIVLLR